MMFSSSSTRMMSTTTWRRMVVSVMIASCCCHTNPATVNAAATTTTTKAPIIEELRHYGTNGHPPPLTNTVCPKQQLSSTNPKYHSEETCNRVQYNTYKQRQDIARHYKYRQLKDYGTIEHIPNYNTNICPLELQLNDITSTTSTAASSGLDTVWIVENQASTPIVLSWINADGREVSARNPKIYPAIHDPNAILQPKEFVSINTYEGHVFTARAILDLQLGIVGPILLQHRAGLIPIGSMHIQNNVTFSCPTDDIEPVNPITNTIDNDYARTKSKPTLPCNTMDVGFRNMIACPVHGYFVTTQQQAAESTSNNNICSERFKFHLGVEKSHQVHDFMWSWSSTTKYERTFIGHTFRFRLAANPNIIVDTITIQPTIIRDCPVSKTTTSASTFAHIGTDSTITYGNTSSVSSSSSIMMNGIYNTNNATNRNEQHRSYTKNRRHMVATKQKGDINHAFWNVSMPPMMTAGGGIGGGVSTSHGVIQTI